VPESGPCWAQLANDRLTPVLAPRRPSADDLVRPTADIAVVATSRLSTPLPPLEVELLLVGAIAENVLLKSEGGLKYSKNNSLFINAQQINMKHLGTG
jgi:hypothetical protein